MTSHQEVHEGLTRVLSRFAAAGVVACVLLAGATAAHGASTCEKRRFGAAGDYARCELKRIGTGDLISGFYFDGLQKPLSKCRIRYASTWAKLQAAACGGSRLTVPGDGTVTDNLTGLVWEQKTALDGSQDLANPHDADNVYTWSDTGSAATGTAFTNFLAKLNDDVAGCFAGHCDWRLPTRTELQTILSEPYPCATSPCIDEVAFGPTAPGHYYAATTHPSSSLVAWEVSFMDGRIEVVLKTIGEPVRAVRGGLL